MKPVPIAVPWQKPAAGLPVMQCTVRIQTQKFLQATLACPKVLKQCQTSHTASIPVGQQVLVLSESFPNLSSCAGMETSHPSVTSCPSSALCFPGSPGTPASPCVLLLLGLCLLVLLFFSEQIKQPVSNSRWGEKEPFGLWWFNQANPWPPFPAISGNWSLLHQCRVESQLKSTSLKAGRAGQVFLLRLLCQRTWWFLLLWNTEVTSGQEGTWKYFLSNFLLLGGKVDARDTWAGVLTEFLESVISRWAEHFLGHRGVEVKEITFLLLLFFNLGRVDCSDSQFSLCWITWVLQLLLKLSAMVPFIPRGAEILSKEIMESHSTWSLCSAAMQLCYKGSLSRCRRNLSRLMHQKEQLFLE